MIVTLQRKKRKRKLNEDEDGDTAEANGGGGHGIYRKNAHKKDYDFDYGSEYRAKVSIVYSQPNALDRRYMHDVQSFKFALQFGMQ